MGQKGLVVTVLNGKMLSEKMKKWSRILVESKFRRGPASGLRVEDPLVTSLVRFALDGLSASILILINNYFSLRT